MGKTVEQINLEFIDTLKGSKESESAAAQTDSTSLPYKPQAFVEDTFFMRGFCAAGAPKGQKSPEPASKKTVGQYMLFALDVTFYAAIAFILVSTLIFHGQVYGGFKLFGYSGFTVVSDSMQRDIPKGSLVVTREIDPDLIRVNDIIAFIRNDNNTITHQVVGIEENYKGSGMRGFQTQGTENPLPDRDIVYAPNVVGVVTFSMPEAGYALEYIAENIGLVFLIFGGITVSVILLRRLCMDSNKKQERTCKA
jgi:signal peptidase